MIYIILILILISSYLLYQKFFTESNFKKAIKEDIKNSNSSKIEQFQDTYLNNPCITTYGWINRQIVFSKYDKLENTTLELLNNRKKEAKLKIEEVENKLKSLNLL